MNSCSMLFSISNDRILSPGSKESMFSKDDIPTTRSVLYFPSSISPVTLMQDPISMS